MPNFHPLSHSFPINLTVSLLQVHKSCLQFFFVRFFQSVTLLTCCSSTLPSKGSCIRGHRGAAQASNYQCHLRNQPVTPWAGDAHHTPMIKLTSATSRKKKYWPSQSPFSKMTLFLTNLYICCIWLLDCWNYLWYTSAVNSNP